MDEGTVVAVAWLPENSTAWFSWRGSVSKKEWLADFQLWWVLCPITCTYTFVRAAARSNEGHGQICFAWLKG